MKLVFLIHCMITASGTLSLSLTIRLSVCVSIRLFACLSISSFVRPSVCLSLCLSLCPSVCLPVSLCVCLFVCLSICEFACLFVCLSVSYSVRYSIERTSVHFTHTICTCYFSQHEFHMLLNLRSRPMICVSMLGNCCASCKDLTLSPPQHLERFRLSLPRPQPFHFIPIGNDLRRHFCWRISENNTLDIIT